MKMLYLLIVLVISFSGIAHADTPEPMHLTLQQAMTLASKENAQVFAANERVRQAIFNISASRSAFFPQLTGIAGGKRQTTDLRSVGIKLPGDPHVGPFNSFDARLRLTLDIFDPSAIERLKSARAGEKLSKAELKKVRQDILSLTGTLFLEAERADQAVALMRVHLTQAKHQHQLAQLRFKQGTGASIDVDKSTVDLKQAEYELKSAQVHADQTRMDLTAALRLPFNQVIIFEDNQDWLKRQFSTPMVSADVAVSQAQLDVSQAALRQARAGFWPKISASGDYGRLGESPSTSSNTYALGLSVTLPIWEGGIKQAQLKTAQSELKEDEILFEDVKNQDQIKLKEAKNNLAQAKALVAAKYAQLKYAEHQYLLSAGKFKSGLGSALEVDEADSMKALAADDKNEAQALYWTAKINLAHAEGRVEEMFDIQ